MKYLIIGDAGSMHIYNYIKTVLLPRDFEVHLLTLSIDPIRESFRSFYKENGVFVYSVAERNYKNINKKDRVHRIFNLVRKFRLLNEVPEVDICHLHSVYKTSCLMVLKNRSKFDKLIMSYWGGDIEDKTPTVIKIRKKCFQFADAITVTVLETLNEFRRIYGDEFNEKLQICRFSTNGLECIKDISGSKTRKECREVYGIPDGRICITCGYNAYATQHQDRCLEIIGNLPAHIKEKLFIIVPMQYGRYDQVYIDRVKKAAQESQTENVILEEFVPFEMSAQLAIATDIYLHLRDTDAFSNALKEHVYAKSYVIKGKWLKYTELADMKAQTLSLENIEDLGETLETLLDSFVPLEKIELFDPIYELYSTRAVCEQWQSIICRVLETEKGENEFGRGKAN